MGGVSSQPFLSSSSFHYLSEIVLTVIMTLLDYLQQHIFKRPDFGAQTVPVVVSDFYPGEIGV